MAENINDAETFEKGVKPEVSKETLLEVIKELQEVIIGMISDEECEMEDEGEMETPEIESANPAPIGDPDKNPINWPVEKMDGQTDIEAENRNGVYKSDNEDEDNWDNTTQKCRTGYTQKGMKDKNGNQIPNCIPIEKGHENTEMTEEVKKSVWTGNLDPIGFAKRKFSTESRRRMAESGNAMPDGSYPIGNRQDLENAIRSWGRGGSDPKVKAHIKRRAKELGAEDMIPENWK